MGCSAAVEGRLLVAIVKEKAWFFLNKYVHVPRPSYTTQTHDSVIEDVRWRSMSVAPSRRCSRNNPLREDLDKNTILDDDQPGENDGTAQYRSDDLQ